MPIDYIIGGPAMAGQGWRMLVECLSVGRGITLPSNATGSLKAALATGAYAHIRRQFKVSIGKMEGIEEPLARIAGNAYVMDAAATLITSGIMLGENRRCCQRLLNTTAHRGQRAIIDAMDIAGGKGIMLGENNFRRVPIRAPRSPSPLRARTSLTRSMIIFGQAQSAATRGCWKR